ncbi:MAG: acyl-CoA thioesterase [Deltaproteobacteria bacterium]|nr:acyl-CoA thioesterase [Deltaproteobacteria bacterium]
MTAEREAGWLHRTPVTVQFEDVDQYGIVHHPRYLLFMERGRVQLMRELGVGSGALDGSQLGLIVARADVRFVRSARFLDELVVEQGCLRAGASRIELVYRILRGADAVCEATLTLAFVDGTGKPTRAPSVIREQLRAMGPNET